MMVFWPLILACGSEPPPPPAEPIVKAAPVEVAVDTAPPATDNRKPEIKSITFLPKRPTTNDDIVVEVEVADLDGDVIDIEYAWTVNDSQMLHRRSQNLPSAEYKKGDKIGLRVTVSDGVHTIERQARVVEIANSTPFFKTDPRSLSRVDGFRLKADDADGDPITFGLKGEPRGMTIDPKLGILSYKGTEDEPGGKYEVTVVAEDPDKGRAGWTFALEVSPGSKAQKESKAQTDSTAKGG